MLPFGKAILIIAKVIGITSALAVLAAFLYAGYYAAYMFINKTQDVAFEYGVYIDQPSSLDQRTQGRLQWDNAVIYSWITFCLTENGQKKLSKRQASFFNQYNTADDEGTQGSARGIFSGEIALVNLSNSILRDRFELSNEAEGAYFYWALGSWISIAIGMLTTIFVSLSSTEFGRGEGGVQRSVRTLAIIFPALGTAVAALIAFYGPQGQWNLASRTLASLAQLQSQMSADVWKKHCLKDDGNDSDEASLSKSVDEWSKRYIDISAISAASGGASSQAATGKEAGSGEAGGGAEDKGQGPPASPAPQSEAASH